MCGLLGPFSPLCEWLLGDAAKLGALFLIAQWIGHHMGIFAVVAGVALIFANLWAYRTDKLGLARFKATTFIGATTGFVIVVMAAFLIVGGMGSLFGWWGLREREAKARPAQRAPIEYPAPSRDLNSYKGNS